MKKPTLSAGEIAEHIVQLEIKAEKYEVLLNSIKEFRESQKHNFSEKTKKIVDDMIENTNNPLDRTIT